MPACPTSMVGEWSLFEQFPSAFCECRTQDVFQKLRPLVYLGVNEKNVVEQKICEYVAVQMLMHVKLLLASQNDRRDGFLEK